MHGTDLTTLDTETLHDMLRNARNRRDAGQPGAGEDVTRLEREATRRRVAAPAMGESSDRRYHPTAIAAYDEDTIGEHLAERRAQLERATRFVNEEHAILDDADPETETYRNALNNISQLTRERAEQRAIIKRLERALETRQDADAEHPRIDLVDHAIATEHGLPVSIDEAGDTQLAKALWNRVVTGAETFGDDTITVAEAARRVADLYGRIWNPPTVTLDLDDDTARSLAEYLRDAAKEAKRENPRDWTIRVVRSLDKQTCR